MSVHKRPLKGGGFTYVVRWRDPKQREKTFLRKRDAEDFTRSVRLNLRNGTYNDPSLGKVTFKEWFDRWWPTIEHSNRALNTVAQYESILRLHVLPHLGHRKLRSLRKLDMEEWIATLYKSGMSGSTIRSAMGRAKTILSSAVDSELTQRNPMSGIKAPKASSKAKQALTIKQVESFVRAFDAHYQVLILVLAYGGFRPCEAFALRRRHLDDFGRLTVECSLVEVHGKLVEGDTKNHEVRLVTLPQSVLAALREHMAASCVDDPEAPIFTTPSADRIRLSNFRKRPWKKAKLAATLPEWVTPYTLRHTAASLLAQLGIPPHTAAAMLGHDPAVFLRTYAHLYPEDLKNAAAALEAARADELSESSNEPSANESAG